MGKLAKGIVASVGCFLHKLVAFWSHADAVDWDLAKLGYARDVMLCRRGQVGKGAAIADVFAPAGQGLVDGFGTFELLVGDRRIGMALAIDIVSDGQLKLFQAGQDVHLRQHKVAKAVDADGIAQHDDIEPAAAPGPSGCGAKFIPEICAAAAQMQGDFAIKFSGHGSTTDAGAKGFCHAENALNVQGTDA